MLPKWPAAAVAALNTGFGGQWACCHSAPIRKMLDITAIPDEGVPYLHIFLGFTVLVYIFHTYLDVRQLKVQLLRYCSTATLLHDLPPTSAPPHHTWRSTPRPACGSLLQAISRPKPPPALAEVFTHDLYKKTQAYSLDKWCGMARMDLGATCTHAPP